MTKYKVTVQFLKDFMIEADSPELAKEKAAMEATALNFCERFFAQEPKDLGKPAKEQKKK